MSQSHARKSGDAQAVSRALRRSARECVGPDFVAGWFELGPARFEYCPGADRQRPPNENVFLPLRATV
jgi:hypothetical protein